MAMNLDAVLKIAAQVTGIDSINKLEKSLMGAEKAAGAAQDGFKAVIKSSAWQGAAAAAAGFTAALGLSARAAIQFESSMADVRKVVNGLETPKAFAEIKGEILDLSRELPITAKGFAEIYAAAGQSGIARNELKEFATSVAQVAIAFDMTAEDAGRSLAQLRVSLGLSNDELRDLADSMNYVSNNTGATASNLVEFMTRAGSVGNIAGLSGQQTAAFGAAMIQTGVQTEVAATSFNNMIKALSRGPSMTDRQKDALSRLGYEMVNAATEERNLTRVVEAESRKRIDAARAETQQLNKEINRRYRDQLQILQDAWDDEASAAEDSIQDQAEERIKSLQRQQDQEIRAAQDRAEAYEYSAEQEVYSIRDAYEQRIDEIRDASQREIELNRRAARDRQQIVKDQLDDQQEAELQGVQERFQAVQEQEQQNLEEGKADAKRRAEELAGISAQAFADRLQGDAIGTITEVLQKIADLPKAQQISVLSDLFGDEARGLAPLLNNLGELERILGLAGDKGAYTGSVLEEFQVRSETAANKMQLFNNNLQALAIVTGDTVLPALVKLAEIFGPIIQGLANLAAQNPVITTAFVAIGGILSAIVFAAPFLVSTITLLGQMGPLLGTIGATIAGYSAWLLPIQGALTALLGWIGSTFIPGIVAFFSGPVGWTVLAVAAVVAMCVAFREPIGQFFSWLGGAIAEGFQAFWDWIEPLRNIFTQAFEAIKGIVSWGLEAAYAVVYQLWVQPWENLWNMTLREPVEAAIDWLKDAWTAVSEFIPEAMDNAANFVQNLWTGVVDTLKGVIRGFLQAIGNNINSVTELVNRLIGAFNKLPGPDIPQIPMLSVPAFATGGVVNRPTMAMVGEAGTEYIVPESKMAAASANYLAGSRGADVLNGNQPRTGAPVINITTGPVVEFDGKRYVSMDDLERAMRVTAEGVIGRLRTPSARIALGAA